MLAILSIVFALLVAVLIHEAAHALALRQLGIRITDAGLGLPYPPKLTVRRAGINWSLSIWLFGAYVGVSGPGVKQIQELPYRERAWYSNAGIVVNLVFGFGALAIFKVLQGGLLAALGFLAVAAAIWLWRYQVAAYILPALALPLLALFFYQVATIMMRGGQAFGFAGLGSLAPSSVTLMEVLLLTGVLSIAVGVLNATPIAPMDNAQVCSELLERAASATSRLWFDRAGYTVMAVMFVMAIWSDLLALVRAIF